jgi:hypothetical protein
MHLLDLRRNGFVRLAEQKNSHLFAANILFEKSQYLCRALVQPRLPREAMP